MSATHKSPSQDTVAMRQFNFKVVDSEDPDAEVPVLVAGQIMIDVQNLLTDVGCLMVRQELRTQSELPEGVADRFTLKIQGGPGSAGSDASSDGTLLEDALAETMAELDRANMASAMQTEPGSHTEAEGRRRIATDILALQKHLDGRTMMYGIGDELRKFRVNPRRGLEGESSADISGMQSAVVGILSRDPVRHGRWVLSNGIDSFPAVFPDAASGEEAFKQAGGAPSIVTGAVVLDEGGRVVSMKDILGCYPFPSLRFHRAITRDRDIPLLNPAEAAVGYDRQKGRWTLVNSDLGISVSKPSWDEAVAAFHEYFVFLWETYVDSGGVFEGEELEVQGLLRSMAFPDMLRFRGTL